MKIALRWLGRYVDLDDKTPAEVLADLTMSTAEVEGIEVFAPPLEHVVTGHVVACEKHQGADKLSVTRVDAGTGETLQIVCGAQNVKAGQRVVVALPGAVLPGGLRIGKAKLRGVESSGMICSESELGLSEASDGILELDPAIPIGKPFAEALGVSDHVLEIDNKSINHRPDLWGHYGIARELAAIWARELRPQGSRRLYLGGDKVVDVSVTDRNACPRYLGVVVGGVRTCRSPDRLRWALASVGQRSIDFIVDLTNFVMLDLGQPMHAFDFDKLGSGEIGVRFARAGERLTTLDGIDRQLVDRDLLITAGDRPIALAGVMGGASTKVDADTRTIFLESATFHAATVRRTSTRLGLRSDASTRFEKSLDPSNARTAMDSFIGLLERQFAECRVRSPLLDPTRWRHETHTVALRKPRLDLKLGVSLPPKQVAEILQRLAFGVRPRRDEAVFDVDIPSFRATKDIAIEDDLIEEVGRMFRYDNIPEQPLRSIVSVPPREPELWFCRSLAALAASELGSHEVYDYSFVPDAVLCACGAEAHRYVRVNNPVAPEASRMRRHVMPSLLAALAPNLRRAGEVRLFEEGKGYWPERRDADQLPHELREFAFAWARTQGEHPYAELRAGLESVLGRFGREVTIDKLIVDPPPWVHPGRTAQLERGGAVVGYVGAIHPAVARALGINAQVAVANVDVRALLATPQTDRRYQPISTFPSQPVDVALLVARGTRVATVAQFLRELGREGDAELVQDVRLFETYVGEGIPADQKSLNFTVTLGAMDRTLSSKDEERYLSRLRARCTEIGATLRG